ncbi:probable calcium-binding protein CML49 [Belonocnema kinseyi]|uniref:probable calcium-binding protein CML49 n=1 Tax=Belonocnema kinseyi TaxID=2817044 RepID=UPI00143DE777|nr:probable calcium-binding protein CML49 [Belonocnema kinseyi]
MSSGDVYGNSPGNLGNQEHPPLPQKLMAEATGACCGIFGGAPKTLEGSSQSVTHAQVAQKSKKKNRGDDGSTSPQSIRSNGNFVMSPLHSDGHISPPGYEGSATSSPAHTISIPSTPLHHNNGGPAQEHHGGGYGAQQLPQGGGYGAHQLPHGGGHGAQPLPHGGAYGAQPLPQGGGYGAQPAYQQGGYGTQQVHHANGPPPPHNVGNVNGLQISPYGGYYREY